MPYIVIGKQKGPALYPATHENRESADQEARRLATVHDDEFTVYASLATYRVKRVEVINVTPRDLSIADGCDRPF